MGITVGSIGLGAVFPSVNLITRPFLCRGGQMELVTQDYHPSPIEVVTTLTWYCVDAKTGVRQQMNMWQMSLIAGTIYGLLLAAAVFAGWWLLARSRGPTSSPTGLQEMLSGSRMEDSSNLDDLVQSTADLRASTARLRQELQDRVGAAAAVRAGRGSDSVEQRLAKLKGLRDSGLITEQEYAAKKAEILSDL